MSSTLTTPKPPTSGVSVRRLLVCWQNPETRSYHAVGFLDYVGNGHAFTYLDRARHVDGFQPFIGFPELGQRYESPRLFPLFAERVMDPKRPDRPAWLEALGLDEDAGPMEVLARSGGHRRGDRIELLPEPVVRNGVSTCGFLVHGVRHQPGSGDRIDTLTSGDALQLAEDHKSGYDDALVVLASDGQPLGWVPSPLLEHVHTTRAYGDPALAVLRANDASVGPHLRLLVQLTGHVPEGYRPFSGPTWRLAIE